ncbi:unnamed protein product, partial [Symbiodinium necroappetens]
MGEDIRCHTAGGCSSKSGARSCVVMGGVCCGLRERLGEERQERQEGQERPARLEILPTKEEALEKLLAERTNRTNVGGGMAEVVELTKLLQAMQGTTVEWQEVEGYEVSEAPLTVMVLRDDRQTVVDVALDARHKEFPLFVQGEEVELVVNARGRDPSVHFSVEDLASRGSTKMTLLSVGRDRQSKPEAARLHDMFENTLLKCIVQSEMVEAPPGTGLTGESNLKLDLGNG